MSKNQFLDNACRTQVHGSHTARQSHGNKTHASAAVKQSVSSKNYSIELGLIQIGPSAPVAHALQTDSGKLCGRLKRVRPEVFVDKPGKLRDRQWSLHIDGNIPGVIQRINRVPFNRRDKVKAEFDKLMERDIIECVDTPSEWVLPVFTSHGKN